MESSLVYTILFAGLMLGCGWAFAAYGAAFRATRRPAYRERAIAWLGIVIAYTVLAVLIAALDSLRSTVPFMIPAIVPFAGCFSAAPDKKLPEYRSSRAIMLFQPPTSL